MPVWFVPAVIFVARTAAPFVARSLLGVGARQVGRVTAAQIAGRAALGGGVATGANLTSQALDHGTEWDKYNVEAALWDGAMTAVSVGGGVAVFSGLKSQGIRRFAIEFGGSLGIQGLLTAGRVVMMGTDPTATALSTMSQTPFVYARRKFIISRLIPGGMNSTAGVLVDQGISFLQEVTFRRVAGVKIPSPSSGSPAPSEPFLDEPIHHEPQLDFTAMYGKCTSCGGEIDYSTAAAVARAVQSGQLQAIPGDLPGHDETCRLQRALQALDFYRGPLDGVRGPRTTFAMNNYAASQLGLKVRDMKQWTQVTELAYLRMLVARNGNALAPLPGERPLTAEEQLARTRAPTALVGLEAWYRTNVGPIPARQA